MGHFEAYCRAKKKAGRGKNDYRKKYNKLKKRVRKTMELCPDGESETDETCSEASDSKPVQDSSEPDTDVAQSSERLRRVTGLFRVRYARVRRAEAKGVKTKNYSMKVKLNGKSIRLLIDTGSPISIISRKLFKQLFGDKEVTKESSRKFADFNSNEIPMWGDIQTEVSTNGWNARDLELWISADEEEKGVIGLSWLRHLGVSLRQKKQKVRYADDKSSKKCIRYLNPVNHEERAKYIESLLEKFKKIIH
ncbi:MAG: retropepsin-like aspartic protease [Bacteroidota bacterium]